MNTCGEKYAVNPWALFYNQNVKPESLKNKSFYYYIDFKHKNMTNTPFNWYNKLKKSSSTMIFFY